MSRTDWIKLVVKVAPIIIGMTKPELLPIADAIADSIGAVEDNHPDDVGPRKLERAVTDVTPEMKGLDAVTVGDLRHVISAVVDSANLIRDVKRKVAPK